MKLTELIYKMRETTMVFITDDPVSDEGIYFGAAGDMKVHFATKYEVVEMYAEYYHAAYCCGITVIVKPTA